jgi:hypothetical protein
MTGRDELDLIGTAVELTGSARDIAPGTRGQVTGYGARRVALPIQVTFDDAARTVRHYTHQQFGWHFTILG